jgi:hypothetical protein
MTAVVVPAQDMPCFSHPDNDEAHSPSRYYFHVFVLGGPLCLFTPVTLLPVLSFCHQFAFLSHRRFKGLFPQENQAGSRIAGMSKDQGRISPGTPATPGKDSSGAEMFHDLRRLQWSLLRQSPPQRATKKITSEP